MLWAIISILIVIADQVSKQLVLRNIAWETRIPVINGFFYLTYRENSGAAWSILQSGRIFFLVITPIIAAGVIYFMIRSKSKFLLVSLSLILGGAAGNFIDRLFRGQVVDFLDFHFGSYIFPTFNVADSFICVGTALLAYYLLFIYKEPVKQKELGDT